MSADLNILVEMGFETNGAAYALQVTDNKGVEAAMEWLLAHPDAIIPDTSAAVESTKANDPEMEVETPNTEPDTQVEEGDAQKNEASSIKCEDCQKYFKNEAEVEFHAVKTGHTNFSESTEQIKEMSPEEKQEQIKRLEEKIRLRRMEKEEQLRKERIEKEKLRRREGQELANARQRLQDEEMRRMAEQVRREKAEAKQAKQRVLEQIEKDKIARQEKFGGSGLKTVETAPASSTNQEVINPPQQSKTYDQCRLQIRLTNGQTLVQSFSPNEQLSAVRLYVELNRTDGDGPFSLMTNFPKKVFNEDEMNQPLIHLGLVPSAVIIVTKQA